MEGEREKVRKTIEEHERNNREAIERMKQEHNDSYSEYLNSKGWKHGLGPEDYELSIEEMEGGRNYVRRAMLISRLRPIIMLLGTLMASVSIIMIWKPETYLLLTQNVFASALGLVGVLMFILVVASAAIGSVREKTFVDIDDKLYGSRVELAEFERDEALNKIRILQSELNLKSAAANDPTPSLLEPLNEGYYKLSYGTTPGVPDSQGFDHYLKSVIRSLDMNIELADNKASLLLDKGTTYLWRGILFYVLSIVVWQIATAYFKVGEYAVWGMVSCSMTFLVVEFLAAWFLRQYKSFTDSSFNLVRVKSVFNRYLLSYLAIKEFSDASQHLVDMRVQMLKVLEEDIKWLEPNVQKAGELNHMVAMFESVSGLVEKLKASAGSKDTAST